MVAEGAAGAAAVGRGAVVESSGGEVRSIQAWGAGSIMTGELGRGGGREARRQRVVENGL